MPGGRPRKNAEKVLEEISEPIPQRSPIKAGINKSIMNRKCAQVVVGLDQDPDLQDKMVKYERFFKAHFGQQVHWASFMRNILENELDRQLASLRS